MSEWLRSKFQASAVRQRRNFGHRNRVIGPYGGLTRNRLRGTTAQQSIPYIRMLQDGICQVTKTFFSKTIQFYDINYQLAQNEDKNAIFENWCDFLNYFDASIHFQLSFINHKSSMKEFEQVIRIRPQDDAFDDVRMEYAKMLKQQLAKGNNGLVKSKYITFSIEADNIREAKPKLERIESDILNNFKILGVPAYPLNGVERRRTERVRHREGHRPENHAARAVQRHNLPRKHRRFRREAERKTESFLFRRRRRNNPKKREVKGFEGWRFPQGNTTPYLDFSLAWYALPIERLFVPEVALRVGACGA